MANTRLRRDVSSSGSDTKGTISAWVKRSKLGTNQVFICGKKANTERVAIGFSSEDRFEIQFQDTSNAYNWRTNALYRDTFAWYNCVIQLDTGNATATSRARVWINNEEITSWNVQETVPQNLSIGFSSSNNVPHVGARGGVIVDKYFDGIISHLHFIDGTAYDATAFGQYDANSVWTIKTSPSVTYGTNGFFILKNGNSVTDQSGNGNNFTVADGTLTNTEDNPSNVFATFNPLMHFRQPTPLLYGNTGIENGDAQWENGYGTIATPTTGKFYAEFKYPVFSGTAYGHVGIIAVDDVATQASGYLNFGDASNSWSLSVTDGGVYNSGSIIGTYSSISANGIIGIAIDCTNSKLYYSVNGTWQNSADPSAGTGGISITSNKEYYVGGKVYSAYINANYGNGYFGTTAVASAGTNASGIGIFEYDVPTGYTALSTKGLNL